MIVFLDIDGVLLPIGSYDDIPTYVILDSPHIHLPTLADRVDQQALEDLKRLVAKQDAKLVLISSWRYLFSRHDLEMFLRQIGLFDLFHDHWVADHPERTQSKQQDMLDWLRQYETNNFLIIDDEPDLYLYPVIAPDPKIGFRYPNE